MLQNMHSKVVSFLQLIRLPAGCSIISSVFVAHTLSTQGNINPSALTFSLIASLCLYFGGMILNDCFDYSEDSRERPERPLPSQQINLKTAWLLGYTLLLLGCLSAALVNQQMLLISVILALLILLYDSNLLSAWPRAITMGLCRYTNWLMALAVLPLSIKLFLIPIPILFYVVALTRLSQVETSDVSLVRLKELSFILLISFISLFLLAKLTLVSTLFLIILGGYYLSLILPLIKPHTPKQIQTIVGQFVFGLIPLDAAISLIYGYWKVTLVVLLLIPLSRLIGRKLYVS